MAVESDIQFKICKCCGENKPIAEFYYEQPRSKKKTGSYSARCKTCISIYNKSLTNRQADNIPTEKICTVCQKIKAINNFSKRSASKDKHHRICKSCINKSHEGEYNTKELVSRLKTCKDCGESKPFIEYTYRKNTNKYDGKCKNCTNLHRKEKANKELYIISVEKTCKTCNKIKKIDEFHKYKYSKDGHKSNCKDCTNQLNLENGVIEVDYNFKICKDCGRNKIITEFQFTKPRGKNKGRYSAKCKLCISKYRKNEISKKEYIIVKEKECRHCNEVKLIDKFSLNRHSKDKHRGVCKECEHKNNTTEEYRLKDRQKRKDNHDKIIQQERESVKRRRPKIRVYKNAWQKEARKNPIHKLRDIINGSVYRAIRKLKKNNPNLDLSFRIKKLPCTLEQFKNHLESQFDSRMIWDNHGPYDPNRFTWQIDHIIPQSLLPFDSFDHPNFIKCWSLENLRPLEAIENIKKGNKVPDLLC